MNTLGREVFASSAAFYSPPAHVFPKRRPSPWRHADAADRNVVLAGSKRSEMMMPMGIEQLFRSAAGADWASQGGLSASEFLAALKDRAGADLAFGKHELQELGKHLGLSGHDSKAIFDFLEHNGKVPVDALRDQLMHSAGADKAFNLAEFKGGIDKLLDRATHGHHGDDKGANFRRDAGADKAIDKDEFEAIAKRAGITDQDVIDKAFDKLAGADGKISKDEFKDGLGDTKLSKDDLAKKINELGGED